MISAPVRFSDVQQLSPPTSTTSSARQLLFATSLPSSLAAEPRAQYPSLRTRGTPEMAPPTVLTLAELIELVQLALRSVPILTAALVFHEIFYSSYVTRAATFGLIFCVSTPPWQSHNIKSTFPAYGVGLLTAYLLIVSAVMLLCYNPAKDCRKLDDGKSKESIRVR